MEGIKRELKRETGKEQRGRRIYNTDLLRRLCNLSCFKILVITTLVFPYQLLSACYIPDTVLVHGGLLSSHVVGLFINFINFI